MSSNTSAKNAPRPGRTIVILLVSIVALFAIAFVQGATAVKLGLDLRGGTSVTLQPRVAAGENGKVTSEAIDQAVSIIRQRVNSLGVAESEVSSQGSGVNRQIVISVPGDTGRRVVELVGQTAELRFRQVLVEGAANATSLTGDTATTTLPAGVTAEAAAKFASLDCSLATSRQAGGGDDANAQIVACDRAGANKYVLASAEVVGRDVSKAVAA
ncbi:MAG: protein translocase subunit SecD, partial [Actinobacteria bacterium]|nr:protein translocase subunit SecD [Actinomycetota bacterium]